MKSFWIMLAILFYSQLVNAQANSIYNEDKTGVYVKAEQSQFQIQLKSNPTTGYSWFLREYDSNLIKPIKQEFVAPKDKKLMGAPGYEVWTFQVKPAGFTVPQQSVIRFVYSRPWDGSDQSKQLVFRVSTSVKAPAVVD
jgi:inhibitor of cysteine peptidase